MEHSSTSDDELSDLEEIKESISAPLPEFGSSNIGLEQRNELLFFIEGQNQPVPNAPRKRGRKRDELTVFLSNFVRKKNRRPLKCEYLYAQLIRRHQRTMRSIKEFLDSTGKCEDDRNQNIFWQDLSRVYLEDPNVFDHYCSVNYTPYSKYKRRRNPGKQFKSFNRDFCRKYFEHNLMRRSFYIFIDYLFIGSDPTTLSEFFNANCCFVGEHTSECEIKWSELKKYIQGYFMKRLELVPCFLFEENLPIEIQRSC